MKFTSGGCIRPSAKIFQFPRQFHSSADSLCLASRHDVVSCYSELNIAFAQLSLEMIFIRDGNFYLDYFTKCEVNDISTQYIDFLYILIGDGFNNLFCMAVCTLMCIQL
jgi:hypothetical protein